VRGLWEQNREIPLIGKRGGHTDKRRKIRGIAVHTRVEGRTILSATEKGIDSLYQLKKTKGGEWKNRVKKGQKVENWKIGDQRRARGEELPLHRYGN